MKINNVVLMGSLIKQTEGYMLSVVEKFTDRSGNKRSREMNISLLFSPEMEDKVDRYVHANRSKILVEGFLCQERAKVPFYYIDVKRVEFIEVN